MKSYLVALATGLLVGGLYGLLRVRSPAPPVIALVGLMGILLGEQVVSMVRQSIATRRVDVARVAADCRVHLFGRLTDVSAERRESGG